MCLLICEINIPTTLAYFVTALPPPFLLPLLRYQVFSYGPIKRVDNFLLAMRQKSKANMLTKTEQT